MEYQIINENSTLDPQEHFEVNKEQFDRIYKSLKRWEVDFWVKITKNNPAKISINGQPYKLLRVLVEGGMFDKELNFD